jgi:hypothetical protein
VSAAAHVVRPGCCGFKTATVKDAATADEPAHGCGIYSKYSKYSKSDVIKDYVDASPLSAHDGGYGADACKPKGTCPDSQRRANS